MSSTDSGGIGISVPYFQIEQTISSARYRWGCEDRGDKPYVIIQWTLSGEGIYENRHGAVPVPAGHAFIAIVPERSSYYYPPTAQEAWIVTWINLYGSFACELARKFRAEFGPVIPLAARGATAAALRRLLTLTAQADSRDRYRVSLQAYAFLLEWWREASLPPTARGTVSRAPSAFAANISASPSA